MNELTRNGKENFLYDVLWAGVDLLRGGQVVQKIAAFLAAPPMNFLLSSCLKNLPKASFSPL